MTISADLDQFASSESNWSGSTQFAKAGYIRIQQDYITRTYLYNFDPLKSHFYIAKLGFTGVYIFFSFLLQT